MNIAKAKTITDPTAKKAAIDEAYRLGNYWLYLANIAGERGDHEVEKRHLARGQKWLDVLNELEGYNDN